jgi:hypothetical protein
MYTSERVTDLKMYTSERVTDLKVMISSFGIGSAGLSLSGQQQRLALQAGRGNVVVTDGDAGPRRRAGHAIAAQDRLRKLLAQ